MDVAAAKLPALGAVTALAFTALRLSGRTVPRSSEAVAFTPQAATTFAVAALWSAWRHRPWPAAAFSLSAAALGSAVLPRTRLVRQPDLGPDATTLRVLSTNCLKGHADADALVAMVREVRPDVLALQEQDAWFMRCLDHAGMDDLLPHRVLSSGTRTSDAALLSRHPLRPILGELPSYLVAAEMQLPDGRTVPVVSAHPIPPVGPRFTVLWSSTLAWIPNPDGDMARGVVAGDFNATLDHPEFRAVLRRGWRDAGAERGRGLRSTWRSRTGLARLTIDHVLVAPGIAIDEYRVHSIVGSDHRAVEVTLRLPEERLASDDAGGETMRPLANTPETTMRGMQL